MAMRLRDVIVVSIEIPLYSFHFSLLILLIIKRKTSFRGAFYNLLRILFTADILLFISSFETRLSNYGIWRDYFKSTPFWATLNMHSVGYLLMLQFILHGFIPFNRFTMFWFPITYQKRWSKQWYTILILLIPIFCMLPNLIELTVQNEKPTNSNATTPTFAVAGSYSLIAIIICCIMTASAAIFNTLAVIKFLNHKSNASADVTGRNDISFLYLSCTIFIAHCLYCLVIIGNTIFASDPDTSYIFLWIWTIVTDVISWSGSLSLIFLSKSTRKVYINFYTTLCGSKQYTDDGTTVAKLGTKFTVTQVTRSRQIPVS